LHILCRIVGRETAWLRGSAGNVADKLRNPQTRPRTEIGGGSYIKLQIKEMAGEPPACGGPGSYDQPKLYLPQSLMLIV
jgi:hypothetical protein